MPVSIDDSTRLRTAKDSPLQERIGPFALRPGVFAPRLAPPQVVIPAAAAQNPLAALPFPNAGDRIRAEDFRVLSQSLRLIQETFALSGALFGQPFSQARLLLTSQQYVIRQVMTVFGTELENPNDNSLDDRKVIQVMPLVLGERQVSVVITEAVETRRFAPNLIGKNYQEAAETLRNILGNVTFPTTPASAPNLVGLTVAQASEALPR
jgi:hypothetical protein